MDHLYYILMGMARRVFTRANLLSLFKHFTILITVAKDEPDFQIRYGTCWEVISRHRKCTVYHCADYGIFIICLFYDSSKHL